MKVEDSLLAEMADTARGPRRNGLFALWLFVRQCGSSLPPTPLGERALELRLTGLEQRVSSLTLPAPLRRALPASLRELRSQHSNRVSIAIQQLWAPAREALGNPTADTLAAAARLSRLAVRSSRAAADAS